MDAWQRRSSIEKLLIAGAKSARPIAAALGTTRNSIIGFCYRRGIKLPGIHSGYDKPRKPRAPKPKPKPVTIKTIEASFCDVSAVGISLADVEEGQCKWPMSGNTRLEPFLLVCGRPVPITSWQPYCHHHQGISSHPYADRPTQQKRRLRRR